MCKCSKCFSKRLKKETLHSALLVPEAKTNKCSAALPQNHPPLGLPPHYIGEALVAPFAFQLVDLVTCCPAAALHPIRIQSTAERQLPP